MRNWNELLASCPGRFTIGIKFAVSIGQVTQPVRRFRIDKNLLFISGIELWFVWKPAHHVFTILTELSRYYKSKVMCYSANVSICEYGNLDDVRQVRLVRSCLVECLDTRNDCCLSVSCWHCRRSAVKRPWPIRLLFPHLLWKWLRKTTGNCVILDDSAEVQTGHLLNASRQLSFCSEVFLRWVTLWMGWVIVWAGLVQSVDWVIVWAGLVQSVLDDEISWACRKTYEACRNLFVRMGSQNNPVPLFHHTTLVCPFPSQLCSACGQSDDWLGYDNAISDPIGSGNR